MNNNLIIKKSLGVVGMGIITFTTPVVLENITISCRQRESIINCENEKKDNDLSDHLTSKFEISDTNSDSVLGIRMRVS